MHDQLPIPSRVPHNSAWRHARQPMPQNAGRGVIEGAFALLSVLEWLEDTGLSELTRACGLPKATAHRLLQQLETVGAVEAYQGRYRLGGRCYQLGKAWRPPAILRAAAATPATALAAHTRASIVLATRCAGHALVTGTVTGEAHQIIPIETGMTLPPATAAAQLLAATGPDHRAPEGFTAAEWQKVRAGIAKDGVAFDHGDYIPDLSWLAVPIHNRDGQVIAALCAVVLTGPSLERLVPLVRNTANAISRALSDVGPLSGTGLGPR